MQFSTRREFHLEYANLVCLVFLSCIDEDHLIALAYASVDNLEIGNDATEGIEDRVENKSLERAILAASGCRDALHHGLEDFFHAHACLTAGTDDVLMLASDEVNNLVLHLFRHGIGHVTLVDDGNDFQVMVDGHIEVGDGLRLNPLRGIHHKERALTGSDAATHLVAEIHVSRCVNKVQDIFITLVCIFHLDGVALDGDSTFLLQVHVIQHLAFGDTYGLGKFQEAVGQSGFTVVNMGYDTEIAYMVLHDSNFAQSYEKKS